MSLRKATFSASRWITISLLIRVLLQVAQIMVLARLLLPADFGMMAIAAAAYAVIAIFVDLGLSSALIHFPRPPASTLSTLYWLNLGAAGALALVLIAIAWPLAQAYTEPSLFPVLLTMSLALPLSALGLQFRVMAEKEMRFSKLALIETAAALVGFLAAIVVALLNGGVYALVASALVTAGLASGLAWLLLSHGLRPGFQFRISEVNNYLRYGGYRLGDSLFNALRMQTDIFIGGLFSSATAMGMYALSRDWNLRLANTFVNPIVTRVGLPVMAKVQSDKTALKSVYLQALRMTASVNFPIYMAIAIWSEEVVAILLGDQWRGAAFYMRLFAIWGLIRSTGNPVGSLLYAAGHVRRAFWWNLILFVAMPIPLALGAWIDGTRGLAWAMLVTQALIFYPAFHYLVRPACLASFREYWAQLSAPLLASLGALFLGYGASLLFLNPWLQLCIGLTFSSFSYLGLSWLLNRSWLSAMIELSEPLLRLLVPHR
ncbi:MOP flippase family protein [Luteimonas sp. R10]|uniref:MOP flippase family protein n=1 Tax=Luteimonas sp. R10 TaxID=3108176 RepID=UPI00308CDAE7|nr:MOP flippase family protein [Luteimonas sp. R10]